MKNKKQEDMRFQICGTIPEVKEDLEKVIIMLGAINSLKELEGKKVSGKVIIWDEAKELKDKLNKQQSK